MFKPQLPYDDEDTVLNILRVTGADAFDFLQSQLTQDLNLLDERLQNKEKIINEKDDLGVWAAYCSPKGKVLATFYVFKQEEVINENSQNTETVFYLLIDGGLTNNIVKRLKMFVMRRKVTIDVIETNDNHEVFLSFSEFLPHVFNSCIKDKDISKTYIRLYWNLTCFLVYGKTRHLAWITKGTTDLFTPHMLELDKYAVSFTKGCYPGQEVVARSQYLGAVKRCLHHISVSQLEAEVLTEQTLFYKQGIESGDYVIIHEMIGNYLVCGAKLDTI